MLFLKAATTLDPSAGGTGGVGGTGGIGGAALDTTFCTETIPVFRVIGHVVTVLKILIPLIIIILGIVDLSKAVISSDEKAISKSTGSLIKRFIAGVAIFFIPTIVTAIFDMLELVNVKGDFNTCLTCITDVGNCGKTTSNNKS